MSKSKEYTKNTLILFVGKFCTQFMSFLLLPLYTHYLKTGDYGFVDLIQTYISLLIPILTLRFDSAAFRFLIDERKNEDGKKNIISNIIISLVFQILFFSLVYFMVQLFLNITYSIYIYINIVLMMVSNILLQILRGLGNNKDYSIASIITGVSTLLINIILLCIFNFNASSILIASSIANAICGLFLIYKIKLRTNFCKNKISKKMLKKIAAYSIPMIPNSLSWWIVNVSDRTIISLAINAASNGIYSISCKFSNILNSIFTIFNMSWQEMASLHINDKDAENYFNEIINNTANLFITITLFLLSFISVFFNYIIGIEYLKAYSYIPILLIANIFSIYIGLFGGIYVAKQQTKEVAKTTILSAIINLSINLIFVKKIGLYAAAISTFVAYFSIAIYRYFGIQKIIRFKFDKIKSIFLIICIIIYSLFYYLNFKIINIILLIVSLLIVTILNKKFLKDFIEIFLKKTKSIL